MYPACAILATDFNFLVWFIQQSDHCPKLALQKSLMHLSYPFGDCSRWSSREAQVSILLICGPHQPQEQPRVVECQIELLIPRVMCNVWKESRASVCREGFCFFLIIQHACSSVLQGRDHWETGQPDQPEPRLLSSRCWSWASHRSSVSWPLESWTQWTLIYHSAL